MQNHPVTPAEGNELQRALRDLVDRSRLRNPRLSSGKVFQILMVFAWRYAREHGESAEAIQNQVRADFTACELAHQKRLHDSINGGSHG